MVRPDALGSDISFHLLVVDPVNHHILFMMRTKRSYKYINYWFFVFKLLTSTDYPLSAHLGRPFKTKYLENKYFVYKTFLIFE
jgi:hypothetical protein